MSTESDLAALNIDELRALVLELRQQLTERDEEIARLKHHLSTERDSAPIEDAQSVISDDPAPGSQEDLLAQLELLYPNGK